MDNTRGVVDSQRQPEPQGHRLYRLIKIFSCGSMIGTAVLFPLANAGGLWFRAVTLTIFLLAALVFHSLHIEPFVRTGPYTAPVALLFLLLAVLPAGSSRKELIPWLPLFLVFSSLGTVAVDKASKRIRLRRGGDVVLDQFSGVSIDTSSEESFRTVSDRRGRRPPSQSNRHNAIYFGRYGPPSQYSCRTGSGDSELTLSGVTGQPRPTWDPQTQSYFTPERIQPMDLPGQPYAWMDRDYESEPDMASESTSGRSDHPLLGPQ
ncbi:hypothetical protein B0H66DRAFT_5345 [Apodospora peruviana]|uniref:Uncharacterized protein n=1 Tax=Apodospora peruviana TaxID=516989 RepID=A0AAE0IPQ7_9PEZI|nr:hypothetical protein B0H66DRAFT_5345 [Apodospora peruviana]